MKKIIIIIVIAGSISLGFTLIESNNTPMEVIPLETVKSPDFEKTNLPVGKNDKGLASWD